MRNLDLAALRALQAVADLGGVTIAAHQLNLTQSAVSMQLKRLEEQLNVALLQREGRSIALTDKGNDFLRHARKIIALNDAAISEMTRDEAQGTLQIGITTDLMFFHIPGAIKAFAAENPGFTLDLETGRTVDLHAQFTKGGADLIVTTEFSSPPDAQTLCKVGLAWFGAQNGEAWRKRPLPLSVHQKCAYRKISEKALSDAAIPWQDVHWRGDELGNDLLAAADLGVNIFPSGYVSNGIEEIAHAGHLPPLPDSHINVYVSQGENRGVALKMVEKLRIAFANCNCGTLKSA